jgi:hypothetical protein
LSHAGRVKILALGRRLQQLFWRSVLIIGVGIGIGIELLKVKIAEMLVAVTSQKPIAIPIPTPILWMVRLHFSMDK